MGGGKTTSGRLQRNAQSGRCNIKSSVVSSLFHNHTTKWSNVTFHVTCCSTMLFNLMSHEVEMKSGNVSDCRVYAVEVAQYIFISFKSSFISIVHFWRRNTNTTQESCMKQILFQKPYSNSIYSLLKSIHPFFFSVKCSWKSELEAFGSRTLTNYLTNTKPEMFQSYLQSHWCESNFI